MRDLAPGSSLGGFVIERLLGRGNMGAVYAARDAAGGPVALKLITPEAAQDKLYIERFRREAEAARAVDHPSIARSYGAGSERGVHFLALELAQGISLGEKLKQGTPLEWREAARIGAALAGALAAIHAGGMIHRDLKPDNVLMAEDGSVKLVDFGVARRLDAKSLTKTGEMVGTPDYMAPEQAMAAKRVDGGADLYSLGALVFALVTGEPPFTGATFSVLQKHAVATPPRVRSKVPGVPPALDALVAKLLEKEPAARGDAVATAAAFEALLAGEKIGGRRSRAPLVIGALLAVGVGVGAIAVLRGTEQARGTTSGEAASTSSSTTTTKSDWVTEWRRAGKAPSDLPKGVRSTDVPGQYLHERTGLALVWGSRVRLPADKNFWNISELFMGKYEVTNEQFGRFVRAKKHVTAVEENDAGYMLLENAFFVPFSVWITYSGIGWNRPRGDRLGAPPPLHPVVLVSWFDALKYCEWASEGLPGGLCFDLPTELEWQRMAAWDPAKNAMRLYPWGEVLDPKLVYCAPGGRQAAAVFEGPLRAQPVGSIPGNVSLTGVLDMIGSVNEWCADVMVEDERSRQLPKGDLDDPIIRAETTDMMRATRGGSASAHWDWCTCTARQPGIATIGFGDLGFRVVLTKRRPVWK